MSTVVIVHETRVGRAIGEADRAAIEIKGISLEKARTIFNSAQDRAYRRG